jgi:hypothetical protein
MRTDKKGLYCIAPRVVVKALRGERQLDRLAGLPDRL